MEAPDDFSIAQLRSKYLLDLVFHQDVDRAVSGILHRNGLTPNGTASQSAEAINTRAVVTEAVLVGLAMAQSERA